MSNITHKKKLIDRKNMFFKKTRTIIKPNQTNAHIWGYKHLTPLRIFSKLELAKKISYRNDKTSYLSKIGTLDQISESIITFEKQQY